MFDASASGNSVGMKETRGRGVRKMRYVFLTMLLSSVPLLTYLHVSKDPSASQRMQDKSSSSESASKDALFELHRRIQVAISNLQEPDDQCEGDSKVLVCRDDSGHSGFGSAAHRYVVCLQVAYGLGRVAVFSKPEYAHFGGYSRWMEPVTRACGHLETRKFTEAEMEANDISNRKLWNDNFTELAFSPKYLFLGIKFKFPYPRHIPGTVSIQLHERLSALGVAEPWMWFYGQFMFYLLGRPNEDFISKMSLIRERLSFRSPVLGIHMRHQFEKITSESSFVAPHHYANKAVSIYSSRYGSASEKTIYLASDIAQNFEFLPKLLPPNYRVISIPEKLRRHDLQEYFRENFDPEVLDAFLLDVYLLWESDLLVCTQSSNVCRLVTELKYATGVDVRRTVFSMDTDYYCDFTGYRVGDSILMTTRDNVPKNGENLLRYKAGEIFVRAPEFFRDGSQYISGLMNLKDRFNASRQGLVKVSDIVPWPGWPVYPDFEL